MLFNHSKLKPHHGHPQASRPPTSFSCCPAAERLAPSIGWMMPARCRHGVSWGDQVHSSLGDLWQRALVHIFLRNEHRVMAAQRLRNNNPCLLQFTNAIPWVMLKHTFKCRHGSPKPIWPQCRWSEGGSREGTGIIREPALRERMLCSSGMRKSKQPPKESPESCNHYKHKGNKPEGREMESPDWKGMLDTAILFQFTHHAASPGSRKGWVWRSGNLIFRVTRDKSTQTNPIRLPPGINQPMK